MNSVSGLAAIAALQAGRTLYRGDCRWSLTTGCELWSDWTGWRRLCGVSLLSMCCEFEVGE